MKTDYINVSLDQLADSIKVRISGTAIVYESLTQAMRVLASCGVDSVTIAGDTIALNTQRCVCDQRAPGGTQ